MEPIFEGEIEEYRADANAQTQHHAEVDGLDNLGNRREGELLEHMITDVGKHELGLGTHVERHAIDAIFDDVVSVIEGKLNAGDLGVDDRLLSAF